MTELDDSTPDETSEDFVVSGIGAKDVAPPEPAKAPPAAAAAPPEDDEEPPGAPPEASAAAKQLPKGDAQAGRTLSARARTIQAEINHLTAQKHTTRREAEEARRELEALRQEKAALTARAAEPPPAAAAAPKGKPASAKPLLKDFETYEAYDEANGEWLAAEAERRSLAAVEARLTEERHRAEAFQASQTQAQLFTAHQTRLDAVREAHPDFDTVIAEAADLPTNPMMDTHIVHSQLGGELMHYLATHPEECEQIASLPPGPTLVALGKLEARLETAKSGSAQPPTISKARPPIKPVGSSSGTVDDAPDDAGTLDAHVAYWNRKERESARR